MYYDELFNEAEFGDETSVEYKLRQKKAVQAARMIDKYYDKHVLDFNNKWRDGKYYKQVTIETFGSGDIGTKIRNAVTGARYNFLVGSVNEDLFFKVTDASGRDERREPLILFYDSPEQYENHQFVFVEQDLKQKWRERSLEAQKRLEKSSRR
jgi:hypothetical protein